MKTSGLYHLQIAVSDIERSIAFYTGLLGMKESFRAGDSLVFLHTPGGRDVLTLRQADGPVDVGAGGLQHFGFQVRGATHAEAVKEARRFGAKVLSVGSHDPTTRYAYIQDPDGYVIELDSSAVAARQPRPQAPVRGNGRVAAGRSAR